MINIAKTIAEFRVLVGYLGEKPQAGWWGSEFYVPSAAACRTPIFNRSLFQARYQGATAAAAKTHDDSIGAGRIFHLFCLPIRHEQMAADSLRDNLIKLAGHYHPNHDDGVQICAALLWQLFHHKAWQALLKATWAKQEKGDYDWADRAIHHWPDRGREKCKADKSLAIAHGLEALYVEPEAKPKKVRGKKTEEMK